MPLVTQPAMAHQDQDGKLSEDAYEAGKFVAADQYVSTI